MVDNPFAKLGLERAIDLRWTLRDIQARRLKMSPVSDEDSKAAFALSGALGSQPSQPAAAAYTTPSAPAPAVEAAPAATQESEEDIRRFREWLDGLAES